MKTQRVAQSLLFLAVFLAMLVPAVGPDKDEAWACMGPSLSAVVFSPDGTKLVSAYRFIADKEWVDVRDVATGQVLHSFKGGPGVAFLPDGKGLVTVGRRKGGGVTVRMVTVETAVELQKVEVPLEEEYPTFALSPDGRMLAVGNVGSVHLIDAVTGKERHYWEGQKKVTSIVFSPDGKTLAVVAGEGEIQFRDVATGQERGKLEGQKDMQGIVFSPDAKTALIGRAVFQQDEIVEEVVKKNGKRGPLRISVTRWLEPKLHLWAVPSMKELFKLEGAPRAIFSPGGQVIGTTDGDMIRLWDAATGKEIQALGGRQKALKTIAFSPDNKTLAAGYGRTEFGMGGPIWSDGGTIILWDVATGEMRRQIQGHELGIWRLMFSPDGGTLVSVDQGEAMKFWKTDMGKEPQSLMASAGRPC